ncbi:MAG: ketoacyl-ACP synthase III [Phycisphaeraceae bacterium]|nr:ketoacyl-ACP synthase III [Phycisphaeraceae bacterium]
MNALPAAAGVGVRLAGVGTALPERTLTNDDLAALVDTNDQWITKRTGIKTRHIAEDGTTTCSLAVDALRAALNEAGMQPGDLDMVLLATMTAEMSCPSTAARVVHEVGATPAGAMDITAACSGFVYGLNHAETLVRSGHYKTVAVIGAETLSRITNYEDRGTCILFGDAAGAAILTADEDTSRGCLAQTMRSDGSLWGELYVPRTADDLPEKHDGFTGRFNTLQMNGQEVFKFAVTTTQAIIDETLEKAGITPADLAAVIPHQSNRRILELVKKRMDLPEGKMVINIDKYGNTSAASVPLCLNDKVAAGELKEGDLVLFVAIGGGMCWTTSLWKL